MSKLTIEDLQKIREQARQTMNLRASEARAKVTVHMGTCGISSGAREIMASVLKEIEDTKTTDVIVMTSGCAGLCSREPMATVEILGEPPVKYVDLTPKKVKQVFREHVLGKKIVTEFALGAGSETTA
jgi:NADP-reducing hydrogenase subunit HndB